MLDFDFGYFFSLLGKLILVVVIISLAFLAVCGVFGLISYSLSAYVDNIPRCTVTAIYDGYAEEDDLKYPIVIIDDKKYISTKAQKVLDSSHIGEEVTISYIENGDFYKFEIVELSEMAERDASSQATSENSSITGECAALPRG